MLRDEDIGLARVSFHDMTYFTFFFIYTFRGKKFDIFFPDGVLKVFWKLFSQKIG